MALNDNKSTTATKTTTELLAEMKITVNKDVSSFIDGTNISLDVVALAAKTGVDFSGDLHLVMSSFNMFILSTLLTAFTASGDIATNAETVLAAASLDRLLNDPAANADANAQVEAMGEVKKMYIANPAIAVNIDALMLTFGQAVTIAGLRACSTSTPVSQPAPIKTAAPVSTPTISPEVKALMDAMSKQQKQIDALLTAQKPVSQPAPTGNTATVTTPPVVQQQLTPQELAYQQQLLAMQASTKSAEKAESSSSRGTSTSDNTSAWGWAAAGALGIAAVYAGVQLFNGEESGDSILIDVPSVNGGLW